MRREKYNSLRRWLAPAGGLLLWQMSFVAAALSAEAPKVQINLEQLVTVDTITSAQLGGARAHLNFPYLKQQWDGDLIANYSVGQTQSGSQFGRQSVSNDGGLTWTLRTTQVSGDGVHASLIRPPGQLSHGFGVYAQNASGFTSFQNSRYNSADGGNSWDNGAESAFYSTADVSYSFLYSNFGDVVEADGKLFMSLYGTRLGSTRNESVLFVSDNDGKNWTRRSTIASYTNSLDLGQMGTEGPSETALIGLDNGDLLAVYRTGQPFPNSSPTALTPALFWSLSHDSGASWSAPKSLGVAGVMPLLRKMEGGNVALTDGRYGAKVMFADATGTRWTTPTVIYNGPGSGHTEMRARSDGKYVYIYDQSGFYPPSWNASPPTGYVYDADLSANLKAAILDIQALPSTDPFDWLAEYHGDAAPDSLGQGWQVSQSGSTSARYLAELGQDYIRLNSGTSGTDNRLSYFLDAATNSAWASVDFGRGAVIELRARAGSTSTAEGSASLLVGDGANGSIMLELDSDSVNLEGLGGAASQVEYSSLNHVGFSSRAWHDYRLEIGPADIANSIVATLYLDGNFSQPILTQLLLAGSLDEIRFGDFTGNNNGILELDYLRFAILPIQSLQGDYNNDGRVDAADYVVWRDRFGTNGTLPNDATPESIGLDDYETWRANFGATSTLNLPSEPVPEPGLTALSLCLAATLLTKRAGRKSLVAIFACLAAIPTLACAAPARQFADLSEVEQQQIKNAFAPPPAAERHGPYSTPMYYLMSKHYAYEGDWDAAPDSRCYERMKGKIGHDWGRWQLDRNRPDWQEAMIKDWAELGLNSTHLNIYPPDGKLTLDRDWVQALEDFVALSEKYGLRIGVRIDAPDETKLWSVHPNNPQSQREAYIDWVKKVAALLRGHTIYYVLGDELTLKQPASDLAETAWTPEMYLAYFRQVSRAIRESDPQAKVCMFAASSGEWYNVQWLLEHGYAKLGDGVAINHYDYHSAADFFADRNRLAPGKLFLTSGVGYVSNGTVTDRYPEGDSYTATTNEAEHAAQVAKSMFAWWDLGADAAPYYITLRNWKVDGQLYPRWFGFFGFVDYVIENDQLSVTRYPAWYAFQAVSHVFYNRQQLRAPEFKISTSQPVSMSRAFVREVASGRELLLMLWNDDKSLEVDVELATNEYQFPIRVSLRDFHQWESLPSDVEGNTTTLKLSVGPQPQIIRLCALEK